MLASTGFASLYPSTDMTSRSPVCEVKSRRHCERSEASTPQHRDRWICFVASLLAMTAYAAADSLRLSFRDAPLGCRPAIHLATGSEVQWIPGSRSARPGMTTTYAFAISRHDLPEVCMKSS